MFISLNKKILCCILIFLLVITGLFFAIFINMYSQNLQDRQNSLYLRNQYVVDLLYDNISLQKQLRNIFDDYPQIAKKSKLITSTQKIDVAQKEADKWMMISDTAKWQTEQAQIKLEEAERLKKELLKTVDGDDYLKEQVIELRYQNQMLKEENRSLKDKLEKAYEFMKQFVISGMNLLEKFLEWIGEKVKDVGRGR